MWIKLIVYTIILVQLWVAGKKAQPSSGHMREKRPIMSFRGHEDLSNCIKSGRTSGMMVSGENVSITKYCLTTWWRSGSQITWDVGHSFNLYVGLQRPGWLYVLGIPPRADLPLWTPRARATDPGQGPNLGAGSGRPPCLPRNREHEGRPAAGREKNAEWAKKTHLYI